MKYLLILAAVLCFTALGGVEARPRMFYGSEDKDKIYTYTVSLEKKTRSENATIRLCSGAIIRSRYVLTAAHCLHGETTRNLFVRTGDKDPEYGNTIEYNKVVKIFSLKTYSNETARSHQHDIAIVKVEDPFNFLDSEKIRKVELPEDPEEDYEDAVVIFSGYGAEKVEVVVNKAANTSKKIMKYPSQLKFIESAVMPLMECKHLLPVIVTKESMCIDHTASSGFGCEHDTGGPLVVNNVIIGIRNKLTSGVCSDDLPELFTRVTSYMSFINNVLSSNYSYDIEVRK